MKRRLSLALLVAAIAIPTLSLAQTREPDIYPSPEASRKELAATLAKARVMHRPVRILLDFGGNWCGDCRALDKYCHQAPNEKLIAENFLMVHVNIGKFDQNLDIAKKYGVPLEKGVPALAVLDATGKVVFSQKKGEFESMRTLSPSALTEFLNHWKGE